MDVSFRKTFAPSSRPLADLNDDVRSDSATDDYMTAIEGARDKPPVV